MGGYYLQFIKGNQPTLAESIAVRLMGTDDVFADETWTEEGKGHGRARGAASAAAPAPRTRLGANSPSPSRTFPPNSQGRGNLPPTPGGTGARKTASIMSVT